MADLLIFGGLAAPPGDQMLWNMQIAHDAETAYDIMIHLDSLVGLGTEGWKIKFGQIVAVGNPEATSIPDIKGRGVVVSILGCYNCGKTYLLNELSELNLPTGKLQHTQGISIVTGKENVRDVIFIDTFGSDLPAPKKKLDENSGIEVLLREIAIELCSIVIVVVNRLRATDQRYISQLLENLKSTKRKRDVIIVHNFMDIESAEDIENVIEKEIVEIFEARKEVICISHGEQKSEVEFFCSHQSNHKLRHFIMAKNNSKAAAKWNKSSVNGIMVLLQEATDYRKELNIIPDMIQYINSKLPHLFINEGKSQETNRFRVELYSRDPRFVLAERKNVEDLSDNPIGLKVRPGLALEDNGLYSCLTSMNAGEWQPLYNLYETDQNYYVILDLAGASMDEMEYIIFENCIIIKGCRKNSTSVGTYGIARHTEINSGAFSLGIALKCKIINDASTLKMSNNHGLFSMTLQKQRVDHGCA